MKVLFITHAFAPHYELGGPAYSVTKLAIELAKQGLKVRVLLFLPDSICPHENGFKHDNIEVIYIKPKSGFFQSIVSKIGPGFRFVSNLNRLLRPEVENSDIVHVHLGFIYPGFVVKNVAKELGKPLIYHARGNLHPNRMRLGAFKKYLYFFIFERSILDYASFVIALNEVEEKVISNIISSSKVRIIPNGIDFNNTETKMTHRKVEDEVFQLLYLGRLDTSKGIELLIHALKILENQNLSHNVHLNIAGTGDNDYRISLKNLATDLGVHESVSFHGHIHGQQKADLIDLSHLFVLPSEAEGLSIAILEAFAENLPVLITKECGFEQELQNKAGRYCKRNKKDIAEQILEIKNNYNLYASSFAFQASSDKYSWNKIGLDMLEVYDDGIYRKTI